MEWLLCNVLSPDDLIHFCITITRLRQSNFERKDLQFHDYSIR